MYPSLSSIDDRPGMMPGRTWALKPLVCNIGLGSNQPMRYGRLAITIETPTSTTGDHAQIVRGRSIPVPMGAPSRTPDCAR